MRNNNTVLKVELGYHESTRNQGYLGKVSWPININEDQLTELMEIPGVWIPNTRTRDQIDGVTLWALTNRLLLTTILRSWKRSKPWVEGLLELFENDPDGKHAWDLHMAWVNEEDIMDDEPALELTDIVRPEDSDEGMMLPCEPIDRKAHRQYLKDRVIALNAIARIHKVDPLLDDEAFDFGLFEEDEEKLEKGEDPFDFSDEDVNLLVDNLGKEDQLW